jgi:hypothetical protein
MLRVILIEYHINKGILNEIDEGREILKPIRTRRWHMMGHILRHENELTHRIIEGKIEGKKDRGCPRTSFVKQMISEAGLTSYKKLKKLVENR